MEIEVAELRIAEAHRVCQHSLEYRFELARRARDDLENLRRRGLLLQRLAQLVEQARVLDGDDRLLGEIANQLDLIVGERLRLLAVDKDGADKLVVLEHRHGNESSRAGDRRELGRGEARWHVEEPGLREGICDVNGLLRPGKAAERAVWRWLPRPDVKFFGDRGRDAVHCNDAERGCVVQVQYAELGLADAHRVRQDRLKYWLQLARRVRDDLQHVGGRGLLLERLGEFLFQVGVGCAKAVNVSSRLRCLRTKTGNASAVLRPFASQDHLVGTVTRLSVLTESHDELAALHSITSSARPSSGNGTVRPSVLTVLRLMTNST